MEIKKANMFAIASENISLFKAAERKRPIVTNLENEIVSNIIAVIGVNSSVGKLWIVIRKGSYLYFCGRPLETFF